jgi:hypothetical protein
MKQNKNIQYATLLRKPLNWKYFKFWFWFIKDPFSI